MDITSWHYANFSQGSVAPQCSLDLERLSHQLQQQVKWKLGRKRSMKEMDLCSSRSASALVPGANKQGNVLHFEKIAKSFYTAMDLESLVDDRRDPSSQPGSQTIDSESPNVRCGYLTRPKIRSLLATQLRNLDRIQLKGAILPGVVGTLAEVVHIGDNADSAGIKKEYFPFSEMAITNMVHHGLSDGII